MSHATTTTTTPNPSHAAGELIDAVNAIARANHDLATLAREQRKAISMMASEAVGGIVERQREAGRRLADAEVQRREAAAALARVLGLPEAAGLGDLIKALRPHDAERATALRTAADEARRAVLACQREQRVVQAAATGIVAHLDGLARQVLARMNQAGVYAATGAIAAAGTPCGVDLVS